MKIKGQSDWEFDVDPGNRNLDTIYVKAEAVPHTDAYFSVLWKGAFSKRFDFSNDEDHQVEKYGDDEWKCQE